MLENNITLTITFLTSFTGILLSVVGWLLVRTLKKIDENQTVLFDRMNEISHEFYILKGEHYMYHAKRNLECSSNVNK